MSGLCIKNLTKTYTNDLEHCALKDFSILYEENQIIGLLGDNGAGKTTLLKCIIDLVYPTKGSICLDSENLHTMSNRKKNRSIFFVAEGTRSLWWRLTVTENIKFVCQMMWGNWNTVKDKLDYYLEAFNLLDKKDVLVGKLSRGQQQKVCLLLAVLADSKLIIMDEPTLGLDVSSKQEMVELILTAKEKSNSKIFLISSHDMDFISKVADRISIIKEGKLIADGSIQELKEVIKSKYTYFEVMGQLSDEQLASLNENFKVKNGYIVNGMYTFEIDGDILIKNKMIDYLRQQNIQINTVEEHDMNLEKLYIELQNEALEKIH